MNEELASLGESVLAFQDGQFSLCETLVRRYLVLMPGCPDGLNLLALTLKRQGKLEDAELLFRRLLDLAPSNSAVLGNLGNLLREDGRVAEAISVLQAAVEAHGGNHDARYNLAVCYLSEHLIGEAEGLLRDLAKSGYALQKVYNLLGNCAFEAKAYDAAVAEYTEALHVDPTYKDAVLNRAVAYDALGMTHLALGDFKAALTLDQENPAYRFNYANFLQRIGELEAAEREFRTAIAVAPTYVPALNNLGALLKSQHRVDEAESVYIQALRCSPKDPTLHNNLGVILLEARNYKAASERFEAALKLRPCYAEALNGLGLAFKHLDDLDKARHYLRLAVSFEPETSGAYVSLAVLAHGAGDDLEASAVLRKGLLRFPNDPKLLWFWAISSVSAGSKGPTIDSKELLTFEQRLSLIANALSRVDEHAIVDSICSETAFYIPYKAVKTLDAMRTYGRTVTKLLTPAREKASLHEGRKQPSVMKRICIFTHHVGPHSVYDAITRELAKAIAKDRFELYILCPERPPNVETFLEELSLTEYLHATSYEDIKTLLRKRQMDVIIYTDIGMRPMSTKVASQRIAPLQLAFWGHPETTGLPTIDYYVSAERFEPPEGHLNYTEKLLKLPGIGTSYYPSEITPEPLDYKSLGIIEHLPIILCPGTPFKYNEDFFHVLGRILKQAGPMNLVFFEHPKTQGLTNKLRVKLDEVLRAAPVDAINLTFIPWQSEAKFRGLLSEATLMLDTIHFSGFNTVAQAVASACPVVTFEGNYMRGRLGSGLLREMGLDELVARTLQEYEEISLNLLHDPAYNSRMREALKNRTNKVFRRKEPFEYFLAWLKTATNII